MPRDWEQAFLECLARDGREQLCAELAGVTPRAVRYAKARDEQFRIRVEAAKGSARERRVDRSLSRLRRISFDD